MLRISFLLMISLLAFLEGCVIVRPGEVGIKQRLGRIKESHLKTGIYGPYLFLKKVIKMPVRTVEVVSKLDVTTKDALFVKVDVSILYHVDPNLADSVYINYGRDYEEVMVMSNFRSVVRHICAKYLAKDLYIIDRKEFEKTIAGETEFELAHKGFIVDAVLLRDIVMPEAITGAIQNKLRAEQEALQMDFLITKQRKESERMLIEAEGIKNYNKMISEGLNEQVLKWGQIQALKGLIVSPNSKVIIGGGGTNTQLLIGDK